MKHDKILFRVKEPFHLLYEDSMLTPTLAKKWANFEILNMGFQIRY